MVSSWGKGSDERVEAQPVYRAAPLGCHPGSAETTAKPKRHEVPGALRTSPTWYHPEVDEQLPEESYVYFEIDGEPEFNRHLVLGEGLPIAHDLPFR